MSSKWFAQYASEMSKWPLLSESEESEAGKAAMEGDQAARERLICSNLRLVVSIAKTRVGRGLDLEDLIQAGNAGLIAAADRYDPGKGTRFSTYATFWINQAIDASVAESGRAIRVPLGVQSDAWAVLREKARLAAENGGEATDEDAALSLESQGRLDAERAKAALSALRASLSVGSLDEPLGDDGDSDALGDLVGSGDGDRPSLGVEMEDRAKAVDEALEGLQPRQRRVLELRYGLARECAGKQLTLEAIALVLAHEEGAEKPLCRERMRQLEESGLKAIRKDPRKMRALQGLL